MLRAMQPCMLVLCCVVLCSDMLNPCYAELQFKTLCSHWPTDLLIYHAVLFVLCAVCCADQRMSLDTFCGTMGHALAQATMSALHGAWLSVNYAW